MRSILLALACSVLAAFSFGKENTKPFDYSSQLGFVDVTAADEICLTIENPALPADTALHVVVLEAPQTLLPARVLAKRDKSCSRYPDAGSKDSFYTLKVQGSSFALGSLGIAVTGFGGEFQREGNLLRADLNGNGQPDSFRECASSEGIHFTVWDGRPLQSPRKWHRYYYLGMDIEPDCTEKDFQE